MQNKLQELTDKIYNEGVLKAREEADGLLANASKEAALIVANAQKEADSILTSAQKKADEVKRNLDGELKMSALQALSSVKQKIADVITLKVVSNPVGQVFGDTAYVKSLVTALVSGYSQHGQIDLKIVLPQSKQLEMEEFFKNSLSAELAKGLSVEYSKQFNAGFKVGPKDNSFNVGFTESDFINFFKAYLRPKTAGILFEQV